jgi:hypothetical protein
LGTACKAETSRMKNVSIERSGGKKLCHRKTPLTIRNLHMKLKSNWPLRIHFSIITHHFAICSSETWLNRMVNAECEKNCNFQDPILITTGGKRNCE